MSLEGFTVSILVLVDLARESKESKNNENRDDVSILVLVDLARESSLFGFFYT